jgi:hypothetical protein
LGGGDWLHQDHLPRRSRLERLAPGEHLEQHHADRVEVGARVDRPPRPSPGDIAGGLTAIPAVIAGLSRSFASPGIEDAQVFLQPRLLAQNQVLRLEITVDDLLLVRVRQPG